MNKLNSICKSSCTSYISNKNQRLVETLFRWIGYNAYHHGCIFILTGITLTLLCGAGVLNYTFIATSIDLWVPTQSKIYSQYETIIDNFGTFGTETSLLIHNNNYENLLTPNNLNILFQLFQYPINNITAQEGGIGYTFDDLCSRKYSNYPYCDSLESNIFAIWYNTPLLWSTQQLINSQIKQSVYQTELVYVLGGITFGNLSNVSTNEITGGTHLLLSWNLKGTSDEDINDAEYKYMELFQDYFGNIGVDKYENDYNMSIDYYTTRSIEDESLRVIEADSIVYIGAIFVMVVYLMFTLGNKCDKINSRPWLAVSTVLVMICALIMGYGLGLAFGYGFNSLVVLIPYILLGVGVDDQIIITESVDREKYPNNDINKGAERIESALVHSGLSITLTSFCSVMAFAVGSVIDVPGIRAFCVFAALCFLANDILQFLIFLPLLIQDEKRKIEGRNSCCFCIQHNQHNRDAFATNTTNTTDSAEDNTNANTQTNTKTKTKPPRTPTFGRTLSGARSRTGHERLENDQEDVDIHARRTDASETKGDDDEVDLLIFEPDGCLAKISMTYLIENRLTRLLSRRLNRVIIICLFVLIFGCSLISFNYLKIESDVGQFLPDDSYILDYRNEYSDAFGSSLRSLFTIIILNQDFSNITVRNNIKMMIADLEDFNDNDESYLVGDVTNWLTDFETYINDTLNSVNDTNVNTIDSITNRDEFYYYLKEFANTSEYGEWYKNIVYDNYKDPNYIKATKFSMIFARPSGLRDLWPLRNKLNKIISSDNNIDGFVYMEDFPYAFFEYNILSMTIKNILFASSGVFIILSLLIDIKVSILIIIIVLIIDFNLFGWMVLWNVSLDSLVFLQLVMAVGLTVDYCVHVAHAIVYVTPKKKKNWNSQNDNYNINERIGLAMKQMGVGVAKGSWTTFLGCVVLIFSQSQGFRTFFYMFSGVIIIALAHGMLLIPSLLAEMPFLFHSDRNEDGKQQNEKQKQREIEIGDVNTNDNDNDKHVQTEVNLGDIIDVKSVPL